jgi:hypothetical protein
MGLKYLERLKAKDSAYDLNSLNFHRLVLTAILVSALAYLCWVEHTVSGATMLIVLAFIHRHTVHCPRIPAILS